MWEVFYVPAAEQERDKLPGTERAAIDNAVEKLQNLGSQLPYPHSSAVRGADRLRELRPRAADARGARCIAASTSASSSPRSRRKAAMMRGDSSGHVSRPSND